MIGQPLGREALFRSISAWLAVDRCGSLRCGRSNVGREAGVKAVVYDRYGAPGVPRVEDVPMPSPAAGQVRVRIVVTSVSLSDWECLRGSAGCESRRAARSDRTSPAWWMMWAVE